MLEQFNTLLKFEWNFSITELKTLGLTLGLAILVAYGLYFISRFIYWRIRKLVEKSDTWVLPAFMDALRHTRFFFFLSVGLYVALRWFYGIPEIHQKFINKLLIFFFLLQIAFWTFEFINSWVTSFRQKNLEKDAESVTTISALGFLIKIAIGAVLILLILANFGVDITALVAGLGVGGIAIALATQNILGDLFASISISLDKPFVIGDFVIIDAYMGTIEHIGLKTTHIRSLSGEQIVISNADLLTSRIRNYKRMSERRIVFTFGITYQTTQEKVAGLPKMVKDIFNDLPETRFDRGHFKSFGDFALIYEVVYYVLSPDYNIYMNIQEKINLEIMRVCQESGIEFAYPTQTLYVKQQ